MEKIIMTVVLALAGGYIGLRLKIPAGSLIGAMVAVAIFNIATDAAFFPREAKFYTQMSTGAFIGVKINKSGLSDLRKILKPAVILAGVMLAFPIISSMFLCRISDLKIATLLFGMAPAGITDMTLASMDFDAEPAMVALIQTVRIVFALCVLPPLAKCVHRVSQKNVTPCVAAEKSAHDAQKNTPNTKKGINLFLTLLVAFLGGRIGFLLKIPAGTISFSMFASALFNTLSGRGYMPIRLRRFIQTFAGALIGCTIGRTEVIQMLGIFKLIAFIAVGFILLDFVAALIIHRTTGMDFVTAVFACAPGGLSDMAIIADELGVNSVQVVGMQIVRLVSVVGLYPIIITQLVSFL